MKLFKIVFSISFLCGVFLASSCTFPGKPTQYTGTIHDTKSLPYFLLEADMKVDGPMGTSTWTIGNKVKINAGQKLDFPNNERLQFFKYRSLYQEANGDSYWEISWQEKGRALQKKVVKYSGKAIYAINKKGLKIGLTPPESEDD